MREEFDPYHRWLGIPRRHQPADHYRLLGLERFEADAEVIRNAAERYMAHVRRYQLGSHGDLSQRILNELAAAKACLLDPVTKAEYDCKLQKQTTDPPSAATHGDARAVTPPAVPRCHVRADTAHSPRRPPNATTVPDDPATASRPSAWRTLAVWLCQDRAFGFVVGGVAIGGVLLALGAALTWGLRSAPDHDEVVTADAVPTTAAETQAEQVAGPDERDAPAKPVDVSIADRATVAPSPVSPASESSSDVSSEASGPVSPSSGIETTPREAPSTAVPTVPTPDVARESSPSTSPSPAVNEPEETDPPPFSSAAAVPDMAAGMAEARIPATLVIDWPIAERQGASLCINGVPSPVPPTGDAILRVSLDPGTHDILVSRDGYQPIHMPGVTVEDGEMHEIPLSWMLIREFSLLAVSPFDAAQAMEHQRKWAEYLGGEAEIVNSIGMKLTLIPAGEFLMGSPDSEMNRGRNEFQHRVRITKSYYLGTYEVTHGEDERLMGEAESRSAVPRSYIRRYPVEMVTWTEADEFCKRLSDLPAEQAEGRAYRLPTEAEWEFACRAGTEGPFHFGPTLNGTEANCNGTIPFGTTVTGPYLNRVTTVGRYPANGFGLYDMHGNVEEWCSDWYSEYPVPSVDPDRLTQDPRGPATGDLRVKRGGAWGWHAIVCRSAVRLCGSPSEPQHFCTGFRVALSPPVPRTNRP